jgi:Na+-transporting NADH:ubiquinone oxidoreductase subunit A
MPKAIQQMAETIKIKQGVNIPLVGEAVKEVIESLSDSCALRPADFHGVVPKLVLKEGADVKVGTPIFYDKYDDRVQYCAPVSGEIAEVVRGDKRLILEIRIIADKEQRFENFDTSLDSVDGIKKTLLQSGTWPLIKQRPYDIVANPDDTPKAIFVSAFDSAPLAPDYNFILKDRIADLQKGVEVLSMLTNGKVYFNINGREDAGVFGMLKNVVLNKFEGPHPAGNVGVQIHNLLPINKGEKVWVVNPQDVAAIGYLFANGKIDNRRTIAATGSEYKKPRYYSVYLGTSLKPLLHNELKSDNVRIISGNVLTGVKNSQTGYLGYYHHQITAMPEGTEPEFFGWITPGLNKFSLSRSFFSWLMPGKKYTLDTLQHGEERPFVLSGQYEKVFPFDIYPVYLLKAMITENIDAMEKLGVYEVAPEDFALCEFACTSKIEVQQIVRKGLDLVHKECG